jgi:multiple sugar transport system substrate-binding protein
MMMRTRWPVVCAMLALTLVACGRNQPGGGGAGSQAPPVSTGQVSGDLTVWAMGTEGEKLDVLAKDFMTEFPDVKVKVTAIPWDVAHQKIQDAITTKKGPDVSMIGTTWMGEFAKAGGLDATPENIDPSAFFEGAWNTTLVDGVSYGVPWYVETRLVFYRTDMAQKGGVSSPPANWDDLKALAKAEKQAGAKWGISLQPGGTGSWQTFMPFFWQAGGEILDDQGNFTLDSDACVKALTYYDSFFEEGLSPKAASDNPLEGEFVAGNIGSFISGPWMIGIVNDVPRSDKAKWTVAHQPTEQTGTSFVGGSDFSVLADSDNKPAAWAFIEYLSRPEVQVKWYETVSDLPAVQSAWEDEKLAGDKLLAAFGDQLQDAKAPPAIPTWEQVAAEAIDTVIEQVTVGDMSPEDGCKSMQEQATSIGTGL